MLGLPCCGRRRRSPAGLPGRVSPRTRWVGLHRARRPAWHAEPAPRGPGGDGKGPLAQRARASEHRRERLSGALAMFGHWLRPRATRAGEQIWGGSSVCGGTDGSEGEGQRWIAGPARSQRAWLSWGTVLERVLFHAAGSSRRAATRVGPLPGAGGVRHPSQVAGVSDPDRRGQMRAQIPLSF
jgi:hypothetical protein